MILCEDWRKAPATVVGDLFEAECARWNAHLGWDYRPACRLLELARERGDLPGLIARGARGRVVGWAYFLLHDRTLQIGNLVASDDAAVAPLIDGALNASEARPARRIRTFLYPSLPVIEPALAERNFAVERHVYMRRPLTRSTSGRPNLRAPGVRPSTLREPQGCPEQSRRATDSGRSGTPCVVSLSNRQPIAASEHRIEAYALDPWSPKLVPDVVRLLSESYEGMPQARCFAPDGRLDQWTAYVGQLVHTPACGRFEHRFSVVARAAGGELYGVALVTALADRTAHIAQMAVGRDHRHRGIGERLVREVCERAGNEGFERMTLLVAESNLAAWRLYERAGFEASATFVFADRDATGP